MEAEPRQLAGQLRRSLGTAPAPPPTTAGSGAAPPVVASPAPPTAAPPEGRAVGIIRIPRIGLDKAIVEGTDTADLRQGPGHYAGTPLPGQPGNSAVAGHRTTYGAPFSRLDELRSGDQVVVITPQGTFRYNINRSLVVEPSDVSVIAPVNANELTLTLQGNNLFDVNARRAASDLKDYAPLAGRDIRLVVRIGF